MRLTKIVAELGQRIEKLELKEINQDDDLKNYRPNRHPTGQEVRSIVSFYYGLISEQYKHIKAMLESDRRKQEKEGGQKIKPIGAKIVFQGVDEFQENLTKVRTEVEKYNNCLQTANQSTEQLKKSLKEFGKINTDVEMAARILKQGLGEVSEVQGVITANHISGSSLRRKEINMRTAAALMDFVEKVSSGKSSTGKNCPARDEEIAVLPAVAKILLEVSQRLPG